MLSRLDLLLTTDCGWMLGCLSHNATHGASRRGPRALRYKPVRRARRTPDPSNTEPPPWGRLTMRLAPWPRDSRSARMVRRSVATPAPSSRCCPWSAACGSEHAQGARRRRPRRGRAPIAVAAPPRSPVPASSGRRSRPHADRRLRPSFQGRPDANSKQGHVEAAKQEFDRAVDVLLESPYGGRTEPRIREHFDRLVDRISTYEVRALATGDGFTEKKYEPASIDELLAMSATLGTAARRARTEGRGPVGPAGRRRTTFRFR